MRKERKEELLHSFPEVPASLMEQMKGKGAQNFVVFLTHGKELFARCFHRYYDGKLIERQRYVFAGKEGFCRYGFDDYKGWSIRKEFREPVFCSPGYGYSFDNSYSVFGWNALQRSCMKYSCANKIGIGLLMEYMRIYCKYPNIEYPMKAGYDVLIETQSGYWGGTRSLDVLACIDWKSNNLLKMLRLNRTEFKALKGQENRYQEYIYWREMYPKLPPDEILGLARTFGYSKYIFDEVRREIGKSPSRLAAYFATQEISLNDYKDYIN
ncbi:MAG: hypothetical protein E7504_04220 [Ruminococcus sp.]|nr:hypothetical protein [Ruminococcus sp.]